MGEQTTPTTAHDAHGWRTVGLGPITVAGVVHKPGIFIPDDSDQHLWVCRTCTDDAFMPAWPCAAVQDSAGPTEPPFRAGDRVQWVVDGVMNGNGTVRQYPYRDAFVRPALALVHFDGDPYPLTAQTKDLTLITTDPAGPASSSASTSGTGGLAELLARLQAEVQSLAGMAQSAADMIEGQRRELWDALVGTARLAEVGGGHASSGFLNGCMYIYGLATRTDGPELERLLAAELDSRYGKDRAKGGGPS